MQIIIRELVESGRNCGVLYETPNVDDGSDEGGGRDVEARVIRRPGDTFEIVPPKSRSVRPQGKWKFGLEEFLEFERLTNPWITGRNALGRYILHGYPGCSRVSYSYAAPGEEWGTRQPDGEFPPALTRRPGGGPGGSVVYVNPQGHPQAYVFEWGNYRIYWTRGQIGFVRGRPLTGKEELIFIDCSLTVQPRWEGVEALVFSRKTALFFREIAMLAAVR